MQTPVNSEEEEEELPQKRPKKTKVSKSDAPAIQKKAKKSSSHSAGKEHTKVSRKPVKRAVIYDEAGPSDDESSESESKPEHAQHVLKLW